MKVAIVCILLFVAAYSVNGQQPSGCINKHPMFEQLVIFPSFVSIFGNVPIKIRGPPLGDVLNVQVRLNDKTAIMVNASITGDNVVTCILPFLYKNGRIQLDMLVTRNNNTVETFHGFIYTEKHQSDLKFEITDMTRMRMSWDRSQFDVGVSLDLELLEISGGIFTSRGIIKSNIPNDGVFIGQLDSSSVTVFEKLRNIYVVQLRNSQVSRNSVTNQSPAISEFLNQLRGKSERELNELCYTWYIQDKGAPTDALPCPPTLQKAQADQRFEPVDDLALYNPEADHGFMQLVPSRSGAAQRCVYKSGKLLVGPPSGGNVRSVSPNSEQGEMAHIVADILPWYTCCKLSVTKAYCDLYYQRRPSNNSDGYCSPHCGCITGDPHFTTFDGLYYTFLGLGEFWIIKSQDFSMQGRFTQYLNTGTTVCTVYVMHQRSCDGDVTVQLSLKEKYIEIMIDGHVVAINPNVREPKRTIMHNGASITIFSLQDIRITFSSGYSFKFIYDPYVININAMVAEELKGKFRGLFGAFDGNQGNELTYPNGKTIPTNSDSRAIHDFGMQWKIVCEESLFTYPLGKSFDSFHDNNYVPRFEGPDLDKLSPRDVEACKGSYECLFDLSATGNTEMATGTMNAVQDFLNTLKSLTVGCDRISVRRNGHLEVTNYLEGSTVRLVCNANYKVRGADSVRCVKDSRGTLSWNEVLGDCVKDSNCDNLSAWLKWLCENNLSAQ